MRKREGGERRRAKTKRMTENTWREKEQEWLKDDAERAWREGGRKGSFTELELVDLASPSFLHYQLLRCILYASVGVGVCVCMCSLPSS